MAATARLPIAAQLKFRMTAVVILLVLVATMTVTWVALVLAEQDMKAIIGDQQYALLSSSAAQLDADLGSKMALLASLAENLPGSDSAEAMLAYMGRHAVVRREFRNLHLYQPQRHLLHTVGSGTSKFDISIEAQQYLRRVLDAGKATVSPPYYSVQAGSPAVMVLQPVFDASGRAIMLLGGSIDLHNSPMLQHVARQKSGQTGHTFLMTSSGDAVHHPERALLMKNLGQQGSSQAAVQRALAGFQGWTEVVNTDGSAAIYSFKRLQRVDWILGASYPVKEAFAPMIAMRRQGMLAAAVFAVVAGLMGWIAIWLMLRPLNLLRQHISAIREGGASIDVLQRGRRDEIGELSVAFHRLMAEREAAQAAIRDSEALISNILQRAPDAFVSCSADGVITKWNTAAERTFGWSSSEAMGRDIAELIVPPAMRTAHSAGMRAFAEGHIGGLIDARVRIAAVHRDGHEVPVELSLGSVRHAGEYYATAFLRDITERLRYEKQLAASEKRVRMIADNLPVLIAYLDHERKFQFANATFQHWFGMAPAQLIGCPLIDAIGAAHNAVAAPWLERAYGGQNATYELKTTVQGALRTLETTFVPELAEDGQVIGIYALSHDTTRLKQIEERLTELARTDSLTGIANRLRFEEILPRAVLRARRNRKPLALAYLDIDYFKAVNDGHGHGAGDAVLCEFAARLTAQVRAMDTVARIAGDEFVIIFEQVNDSGEAARLAAKIVAAMRTPFDVAGQRLHLSTSLGVALHEGDSETAEELLARADAALYQAKRQGRDGYAVSD
ncbi:MAG: diguanylate cyclase [Duganella sp.]